MNQLKPEVSVVICAHNPQADFLERVLQGLEGQTLDSSRWELLLIDNASRDNLAEKWDLAWHPSGRVIREDEVGLTAARLRSIREMRGSLAVFVDDDNVLFPDYLEQVLLIAEEWPLLGAWGGQYFAEYEKGMPKDWETDRWSSHLERDVWSNLPDRNAAPFGGGMALRRPVLEGFFGAHGQSKLKKLLGRSGQGLGSYEDFDMAFTACDLGYGIGRFRALKLTHLIPHARTHKDYLVRLCEDSEFTDVIFRYSRGEMLPKHSFEQSLLHIYSLAREIFKGKSVAFQMAGERGRRRARRFLRGMAK